MRHQIFKKTLTIFINDTDRSLSNIWETFQREHLSKRPQDGSIYNDTQFGITGVEFLDLDIKTLLGDKDWRVVNFVVVESGTELPEEHVRVIRDKVDVFKNIINPPSTFSTIFSGLVTVVNYSKFSMADVVVTKGTVTDIDNRF